MTQSSPNPTLSPHVPGTCPIPLTSLASHHPPLPSSHLHISVNLFSQYHYTDWDLIPGVWRV
ncbi:hypothetical protein AKJ16_DCAP13882 [Drosera capensis]